MPPVPQQSVETASATQQQARTLIREAISNHNCAPAFLRLALHDALTFDINTRTGGANASIRMPKELEHRGNEGLQAAVDLLDPIVKRMKGLSFADIIQLAGALSLEALGGPEVPFTAGRRDSRVFPPEGRLPTFDKNQETADQFWQCFRRTGLSEKDALALAGFHPFGGGWRDPAAAEQVGNGAEALTFGNGFYKRLLEDPSLGAEAALLANAAMRQQAQKWADNAELYVEDYADAFERASELGLTLSAPRPAQTGQEAYPTATKVAVGVVAVGVLVAAGLWYRRRRSSRGALS